jgi:NAD-dependent DNA ligase
MHSDHNSSTHFTSKSRLDKAINSLLGIIEGIILDKEINDKEIEFLNEWISEHDEVRYYHPFNELVPVVEKAIEDGIINDDKKQDIKWLCDKLTSSEYYDLVTGDLQRLHAIMGGIIADGVVTEDELRGFSEWLNDHEHLIKCYPYDEVNTLIINVMADKKIDQNEQVLLRKFFTEFTQICDDKVIKQPQVEEVSTVKGLCTVCPEINFKGSTFCFTGASQKYTRKQFADVVDKLGGRFTNTVSNDLNYLVIGGEGNPCWSYACYGRKVEKAINLRKQGHSLLIVHEYDFHDAVEDLL